MSQTFAYQIFTLFPQNISITKRHKYNQPIKYLLYYSIKEHYVIHLHFHSENIYFFIIQSLIFFTSPICHHPLKQKKKSFFLSARFIFSLIFGSLFPFGIKEILFIINKNKKNIHKFFFTIFIALF